jgi:predicted glycoside hydrolase/deacetylase ChbG (UPF0249 family)
VDGKRYLVVTADDFGIGPSTSRGILDLGADGLVTSAVLLVNSPFAAESVRAWREAGGLPELGWHPCLTLDRPILPAREVPSLVRHDGRFRPLGAFLRRFYRGAVRTDEVRAEFRAQLGRYLELVGQLPPVVNTHHHIQVFPPIGRILLEVLDGCKPLPYVRRVLEPWSVVVTVPGARIKRILLSLTGRSSARLQQRLGFPGNDWLAGITDPPCVADVEFLVRWLRRLPGRVVELTCHPGYLDTTLLGRDASTTNGQMTRRPHELRLLRLASFRDTCRQAGFTLVPASQVGGQCFGGDAHAA